MGIMSSEFVKIFRKEPRERDIERISRSVQRLFANSRTHETFRVQRRQIANVVSSGDCTKHIYNYLHLCQTSTVHQRSTTAARKHLYRALLRLTFDSDSCRRVLTKNRVPNVIGEHLQSVQEIYRESKVSHCG